MKHFDYMALTVVFFGIYGLLIAYKIVPMVPRDPKKNLERYEKYGEMFKWASPFLLVLGIAHFFRFV